MDTFAFLCSREQFSGAFYELKPDWLLFMWRAAVFSPELAHKITENFHNSSNDDRLISSKRASNGTSLTTIEFDI